jgi:phenylalanyl-tRNA synthetase beta chain
MRLVLSWLREFVDVGAPPNAIAETLLLRGFEVASVEKLDGGDAVIDLEVTASRPDCLSVLGLARELATAYDLPVGLPSAEPGATVILKPLPTLGAFPTVRSDRLAVTLEEERLCPRYAAAVAEAHDGSSPPWLAERLLAAGVRPISGIVDVTNYVNLEIGQPMHAFDLATLAGAEIRIRRARPGETITTLDGVGRTLDAEMLVIADRDRPQAIAGVMGGAASEVSGSTATVAFESAYFDPVSVRRTSKRLGLQTEASARFERGADIGAQVTAIERAAALIERIGCGRVLAPIIDAFPHPPPPRRLHLRRDRLQRVLGVRVPDAEVVRILRGLGLEVRATGGVEGREHAGRDSAGWDVVAPTFRVDLTREADLIEEVGRHYGFDRLAETFPPSTAPAPAPDARVVRDRLLRRVLTAAGASEAVTFGFIEAKVAQLYAPSAVAIANPLSGKFDTLRPLLLPGLVDAIGHNRRHGRRDARLFELGTRFGPSGETRAVAAAWTGGRTAEHWSGRPAEVDFFDVKGVTERLCAALGVAVRFEAAHEAFLVDGQSARVRSAGMPDGSGGSGGPADLGVVGQLLPAIADARGLPPQDAVFVAELDLDAIDRVVVPTGDGVIALPRYPFVVRDLSIVVADTLPSEIIRGTILAASHQLPAPLVGVSFFDRYKGQGVAEGSVSLSVRLTFQADDRTLTDAEVQQAFDTILAALAREHRAVQR